MKTYEEIVKNPKDTVLFNDELNRKIEAEVEHLNWIAGLSNK